MGEGGSRRWGESKRGRGGRTAVVSDKAVAVAVVVAVAVAVAVVVAVVLLVVLTSFC